MRYSCSFKLPFYKIAVNKKTKGIVVHRSLADTTLSNQYKMVTVVSTTEIMYCIRESMTTEHHFLT